MLDGIFGMEWFLIRIFNESVSFNGNLLSNPPLNPVNNPFNGTNSYTGANDLYNMDLDVFDISDYIQLGDTTLHITFASAFTKDNSKRSYRNPFRITGCYCCP